MARRGAKLGTSVLDLDVDDSRFHSKLSGAHKAAQGFTTQAGKNLQQAGRAISGVGETWTRNVTAPILAAGAATGKLAFDYDETMSQIVALTSVTGDEIDGFSQQILDMAPKVGKGPQELAEAFYFVASAGFEGAEAMDILEATAKAAAAGLGDTATVSKVIGAAVNAYGLEAKDAAGLTDTLVAAIGEGSAEAPEFAGALGNVIGSAAQIGATFPDVTAAIAAMTNVGIGTEEAVTSLNQVFTSLFKPTKGAADALEDMGLSAAGLRQMIADEGLMPTLTLLSEKFGGNAEATAEVFGNVRALRGILALTGGDIEDTTALFDRMQDTVGATGEAFSTVAESDSFRMRQEMARLQTVATELGADVLPMVVDILAGVGDAASDLAEWWRTLDQDTKDLIVRSLAFVAAAGPVLIIVGKLTSGAGALFAAIGWLIGPKGVTALATKLGALRTAALGPVGAIVALGVALDQVSGAADNRDKLGRFAGALDEVGLTADDARRAMESSGMETEAFIDNFLRLTDAGYTGAEALKILGERIDELEFASQKEKVQEATDAWNTLQSGAHNAATGVAAELANLPPEVQAQLEALGVTVDSTAPEALDGISEEAQAKRDAVIEAMKGMIAGIANLFESDEDVRDAWQGLIDRMDDPYTEAERKADIFSKATIANIRSAIQSGDPSVADDSRILVDNMLGQIEAMEPGALTSGEAVPPAIRDGMDRSMSLMIDWIEQTLVPEGLDSLTMEEADEIGVGNIWRYAEGMKRAEQAAIDAAANVAKLSAFQLNIDASSGGWSIIESWIGGMENAYINNQGRIWGVVDGVKRSLGGSLPTEGPLKGGAASGGQSIGESWLYALAASIDPRVVNRALAGVAAAMTPGDFAIGRPRLAGAESLSTRRTGGFVRDEIGATLGAITKVYQLHVDGKPIVVGTRDEVLAEWARLEAYDA